jgi:hypothetical protein
MLDMTRDEALKILRHVAEMYRGSLQEHKDLQLALKVLEEDKSEDTTEPQPDAE